MGGVLNTVWWLTEIPVKCYVVTESELYLNWLIIAKSLKNHNDWRNMFLLLTWFDFYICCMILLLLFCLVLLISVEVCLIDSGVMSLFLGSFCGQGRLQIWMWWCTKDHWSNCVLYTFALYILIHLQLPSLFVYLWLQKILMWSSAWPLA